MPDEPISDLLECMARRGVTVVPVADPADDRLLGTVASHDVVDLVALMDEIQTQLEND